MPRGFSETEQQRIRRQLLLSARDVFGTFGIRKTSVEDLTRSVGISKGAFYKFYNSKEDLYFAVIRDFETSQHGELYEKLSKPSDDNRKLLKEVLLQIMKQVETDPFAKRLMQGDEYNYLRQRLGPEQIEEAMQADVDIATKLAQIWQKKGKLKVESPELISSVLRGIFFLQLHREDIGAEQFDEVIELLLEASIERLIEK